MRAREPAAIVNDDPAAAAAAAATAAVARVIEPNDACAVDIGSLIETLLVQCTAQGARRGSARAAR